MRKIYKSIVVSLLLVLINCVVVLADINIPEGSYRFKNSISGYYLECNGDKSNSIIVQKEYNSNTLPQAFQMTNIEGDNKNYYIISPKKNKSMNISNNNGDEIFLKTTTFSNFDFWKIIGNTDGTISIQSANTTKNRYISTTSDKQGISGIKMHSYTIDKAYTKNWYMEKVVDNGIYRILNADTKQYLTMSGNYAVLSNVNSSDAQKFHIISYADGYSDIMPVGNENYSLSVKGWDSGNDNEGAYISFEFGQSSEGQMWKFLVNPSGNMRIVSQLSDEKKCITVLNSSNNLYSKTYNNSTNNNWVLEKVSSDNDNKSVFIAAFYKSGDKGSNKDQNLDRRIMVAPIVNYYKTYDSSTVIKSIKGANNADTLIDAMKQYQVVSMASHGTQHSLAIYDYNGNRKNYLTSYTIDKLDLNVFKNLKICLVSGCETAKESGNITESISNKGAECVIGFKESTTRPQSITWTEAFNEIIAKGGCVKTAVGYADWLVISKYETTGETDTYKIYGDYNISYEK